jgi:glycosyltransferase involved in cell wall biosynthesis
LLFVGRATDPRKNFRAVLKLMQESSTVREHGVTVISPMLPSDLTGETRALIDWHSYAEDLPAIYRGAEALVVPSLQEGVGIAVLEAMASGVPVLSLRCGGPDRAISESGGGFVCDDLAGLRGVAERVLKDPSLQHELGERGRRWAEQHVAPATFLDDPTLFTLQGTRP